MSYYSRKRNKRLRDFKNRMKFNDGPDRTFGEWKLIDIHQNSDNFNYGQGMDFWCSNGKEVYLLIIEKYNKDELSIFKDFNSHGYLIANFEFNTVTNEMISEILCKFQRLGIPGYRVKQRKTTICF